MLQSYLKPEGDERDSLIHGAQTTPTKWGKPPFGRHKVNWDVAIDNERQCMGFGAII
jgi:hypothetical protein